jgi:signal transduction histidine kinase
MERIAKGDFQVRLNPDAGANGLTNELAKSVNQMAEELNQMEHMRQEFISNVSHEIQSPLTSMRGFARALYDEHLSPEERQHYLGIIETESMRLSRMTDNMLKLASLEAEHVKIELKPYRLDQQIRTLILACEPQWMSKTIEMDVALEEVVIGADEDLLSQVWSNLLHNSIKFTPEGGKVCVEVQQRDDRIECRVTDTGIGIPEEAQAHIFERFYKVDTSRERAREGSGLGLAIAWKIIELHRGTIGVVSRAGTGTSMIVSLPME